MAYATGTVTSLKALLDAIVSFATANGWTLHDTISDLDKVLFSTGSDTKQDQYIRLTCEARTMDFHSQTAAFTAGALLTGQTSLATARILSIVDNGTTGTLSLYDVNGNFEMNEIVTDDNGTPGSAKAGDGAGTLPYTGQSTSFVIGEAINGQTSGATGVVTSDVDGGATGTITIKSHDQSVPWQNGENIRSGVTVRAVAGTFAAFAGPVFNPLAHTSRRRDPANLENAHDFVIARGYNYWDAGTNTGTGEFGQVGPWLRSSGDNGQNYPTIVRTRNLDQGAANVVTPPVHLLMRGQAYETGNPGSSSGQSLWLPSNSQIWDGNRRLNGMGRASGSSGIWSSGTFHAVDLAANLLGRTSSRLTSSNGFSKNGNGCPVWRRDLDRYEIWALNNSTSDQNATWNRWDVVSNAWAAQQNPTTPVSALVAASPDESRYAWDGRDFIYAINGASSSLKFGRYRISTNTWESLADVPATVANSQQNPIVYLPRSVTGAAEDWIAMLRGNNTTAMYIYRVGANVWQSSGMTALTLPETSSNGYGLNLLWDGARYLWYCINSSSTALAYRLDLIDWATNTGRDWTSHTVHVAPRVTPEGTGTIHVDPVACKVKGKTGTTVTYYIVGDVDSLTIGTTIGVGDSYWAFFGKPRAYRNPGIATVGATTGIGVAVSVLVDDSTIFRVGQKVLFRNRATGAIEATAVQAKADSTHITVRLTTSFGSGALVFVGGGGGVGTCLTGDSGWAVFGFDAKGVDGDKQASTYRAIPWGESQMSIAGKPNSDGEYELDPILIFDDHAPTFGSAGKRATLRNVFVLAAGTYPDAQDGTEITEPNTGKLFRVLAPKHTRRLPDDRFVAIGPIN